ncbi:AraC family transcriptional regulator [Lachnospiraceae bacterium AM48-27BH]|nr:AraC family transcriptional regulator [Lachnospiraceae bacterium AM48-27BH]
MKWLENLSNAIEYIESNLDKDISIDAAAQIACCSAYYFQRVFTYVAGISLSEYIRRRRMSQAAFELQKSDKKVLDIALKYGYSSPTAFNRAFQSVHGITPVAAKNMGSVLNAYPPIRFSVKITGGTAMSYRITEKAAMRIVGIRIPLVADMEENQKVVPEFWKKALENNYLPKIIELTNQEPGGILGVTVYENPQEIFYYIAASTTEAISQNMFEYEIPASTWVIFENDGHFKEDVQNVFKRFYTEWLPFSGYEYAGLPDLEVYPVMPGKPLNGHSEVWIGIKKEKKED